MTGYRSKKLVTNRYADPVTLDHIVDLRKENERLRDEVHFDDQTIKSLSEINDRLQKKIERLREVLGQIIIDCDWPDRVMKHARQALKEGE